jgi:hypothetical protein
MHLCVHHTYSKRLHGTKVKIKKTHNMYFSLNIVHVIRLRRMKWPEHIGNMGQLRHYFGWKESSKEACSEMTD